MPWASTLGSGFTQALRGLGNVAQGYNQGQNQGLERAMLMAKLQQIMQEQKDKEQLAGLFTQSQKPMAPIGGGAQGGAPGMAPQMPGAGMPSSQGADMAAITNALGGGRGGGAPQARPQGMGGGMMANNQIPPSGTPGREGLVDLLIKDESGGRNIPQNIVPARGGFNPSVGRVTGPSSASGIGQFTDSTWRGTQAGQGYKRALDPPESVQRAAINEQIDKRGLADWAPYNKKFKADSDAYLSHLHETMDWPKGGDQQAQTAANQISNSVPMNQRGTLAIDNVVGWINERIPDASPGAKLMALQLLAPMMDKASQQEFELNKWKVTQQRQAGEDAETHRHNLATEANAAGKGDAAGWDFMSDGKGGFVRANKRTGQVEPAELPQGATKLGTGGGPRNAPAMIMKKWMEEHPNATAAEMSQFSAGVKRDAAIETGFGAGEPARQVRSLNTVADHLGLLSEYSEAMRNGDIQKANLLLNRFSTETGHPEANNFDAARTIAADEIVRLLTSTGGTEQDRLGMQKIFSDANSPEQLAGAVNVANRFVQGRLKALEQQYAKNDPARRQQFESEMLSEGARKMYSTPVPAATEPQRQAPGAQQDAPNAAGGHQDGDTATNPQTGEKVMWRNGKWEKAPAGAVDTNVPGGL